MAPPAKQKLESRDTIDIKSTSVVRKASARVVHRLEPDDFRAIAVVTLEKIAEAGDALTANERNSLLGYVIRIANMQLEGEPTTKTDLATLCDVDPQIIRRSMERLEGLGVIETELIASGARTRRASYAISQAMIREARSRRKRI